MFCLHKWSVWSRYLWENELTVPWRKGLYRVTEFRKRRHCYKCDKTQDKLVCKA